MSDAECTASATMAEECATMPATSLNTVSAALQTMPTVDTCMVTRLASSGAEAGSRMKKDSFLIKKRLRGMKSHRRGDLCLLRRGRRPAVSGLSLDASIARARPAVKR